MEVICVLKLFLSKIRTQCLTPGSCTFNKHSITSVSLVAFLLIIAFHSFGIVAINCLYSIVLRTSNSAFGLNVRSFCYHRTLLKCHWYLTAGWELKGYHPLLHVGKLLFCWHHLPTPVYFSRAVLTKHQCSVKV